MAEGKIAQTGDALGQTTVDALLEVFDGLIVADDTREILCWESFLTVQRNECGNYFRIPSLNDQSPM
ncbi:hypothetical protein [Rhizobium sp. 9140]|uniref:hypothetical protein n=1 Tax=Rhizobium sp. 9140 TaxID=1761900 RepID=UPI000A9CDB5E|nr:hypothetical protein [Rhizobium sp. 9140]